MAAIVSSQILADCPQRDGTRHVHERHVDSAGAAHEYLYTAPAHADLQAILAARERFRSATGQTAAVVSEWLLARSDAALKSAFGINQTQCNALRVRLQAKVDAWTALEAVEGE